jgi:hypothetical protein
MKLTFSKNVGTFSEKMLEETPRKMLTKNVGTFIKC